MKFLVAKLKVTVNPFCNCIDARVDKVLPEFFGSLLMMFCVPRSGDSTARLWPISESGIGAPIVLQHHFKELENHKNMPRDVTSLEWNVRDLCFSIDHFTVACLVAWPSNESEAGGDLVLVESSLLFLC